MIHIFHTPTGWKVCQEYPEELDYPCLDCTKMDCDAVKCTEKYDQAVALSIANAVDVREEDWDYLKNKVNWASQGIAFDDWEPDDDHVYSLPELEMEIEEVWVYDQIYRKLAHVFRKKEEKGYGKYETMKEANEDFDKNFPGIQNQSPPPGIEEESQEELWQMIQDEMIEDFKWPKDLLELLKSKFHLTRVKAELKGEKK